jgi:hypothetical protein
MSGAEAKADAPAVVQSDEVELTTHAQVQELLRHPRRLRVLKVRVELDHYELGFLCARCCPLVLDEDGSGPSLTTLKPFDFTITSLIIDGTGNGAHNATVGLYTRLRQFRSLTRLSLRSVPSCLDEDDGPQLQSLTLRLDHLSFSSSNFLAQAIRERQIRSLTYLSLEYGGTSNAAGLVAIVNAFTGTRCLQTLHLLTHTTDDAAVVRAAWKLATGHKSLTDVCVCGSSVCGQPVPGPRDTAWTVAAVALSCVRAPPARPQCTAPPDHPLPHR